MNKKERKIKVIESIRNNEFLPDIFTVILCIICGIYLYLSYYRLEAASDSFHFSKYGEAWWLAFIIPSLLLLPLTISKHRIAINIVIILIMTIVHQSIHDVKETINNAKFKNRVYTIVTTDQGIITTDSSYYFVGRTHNYIFLFNSTHVAYEDIPLTQIKKISFTNK